MTPRTREALEAICRRALQRSLDDCPPVLIPAGSVTEALFPFLQEIGPIEVSGPLKFDAVSEQMIFLQIEAACRVGNFSLLRIVKPEVRNELREYFKMAIVAIELMAHSDLEYGPVTTGLTGADLARACRVCNRNS